MSVRERLCAAILAALASMAHGMAFEKLPARPRRIRYFNRSAALPAKKREDGRRLVLIQRRKSAHNR